MDNYLTTSGRPINDGRVVKDVAVIGAGIAGLSAAYLISRRHRVHLFEREPRLGGHTHTVTIETPGGPLPLDTGFLVHNDRTYPNLVRLFGELGVATRDSDMSFGVSCQATGLEYSSRGAKGFFAQRRNLWNPAHLRLLSDIMRFNREAPAVLRGERTEWITLGAWLDGYRFGDEFIHRYLLPMASAIWSASRDAIRRFPALTMIRFLDNHGLLGITGQPTWKVVAGGSATYIPKLTASLGDRVHTGVTIDRVCRDEDQVTLTFTDRPARSFDEVVFACHGDQVLPMLAAPTPQEQAVFSRFHTTTNSVWLHTDASLLPASVDARASWNYRLSARAGDPPCVTYDLNRLQRLAAPEQYCVTLNPQDGIDPSRVLRTMTYRHPLYDAGAIAAQQQWPEVSGRHRTHYCGAYWGYGFHEDGLVSAMRVARALGVDW
jgi:predicted NAD/FAD-binding protein